MNHYDGPGRREPGDRGELSPAEAAAQIRFLEEEVALLRRKLTESPRHARVLEQRLAESASRLAQLWARNTLAAYWRHVQGVGRAHERPR